MEMSISAQLELGKFLQMFAEGVRNLTMTSGFIDEIWHKLMKDESKYRDFCSKYAGKHVGHVEDVGEGTVQWVYEYEKRFGSLHPLWFTDENGKLDLEAYEQYKLTGIWERTSWRCRPIPGDGDGGGDN